MSGRRAVDVGLALSVLALSLAVLAAGGLGVRSPDAAALDWRGIVLATGASAPLLVRRRAPLTCYVTIAAATGALLALRFPVDFPFGCVAAVYTLATTCTEPARRFTARALSAAFVPVAGFIYALSGYHSGGFLTGLLFWAAAFAGAWLAGELTRLRRERIRALEARAVQVQHEAERDRQLAVAQERVRIARELHDSAGHAINVILVQAGAARLLYPRDPQLAQQAVGTVESVARDTIAEIDRLVHALRSEEADSAPFPANPGALEDLIDQHRADGLHLATELTGPRDCVPRSVAWAAYRILQESLTNAARHGAGSATVSVRFGPCAVEIQVTNPTGDAPVATERGHGIIGMRERADLLGGALEAVAERGVFRLHALLPYQESAA